MGFDEAKWMEETRAAMASVIEDLSDVEGIIVLGVHRDGKSTALMSTRPKQDRRLYIAMLELAKQEIVLDAIKVGCGALGLGDAFRKAAFGGGE